MHKLRQQPFAHYAAQYWYIHAQNILDRQAQASIEDFLERGSGVLLKLFTHMAPYRDFFL